MNNRNKYVNTYQLFSEKFFKETKVLTVIALLKNHISWLIFFSPTFQGHLLYLRVSYGMLYFLATFKTVFPSSSTIMIVNLPIYWTSLRPSPVVLMETTWTYSGFLEGIWQSQTAPFSDIHQWHWHGCNVQHKLTELSNSQRRYKNRA